MTIDAVPLVQITRGALIESVHRGHIAVVDRHGHVAWSAGHARYVTYARSTAKLLQAVTVVASGAAEQYRFEDQEIALLCASHSGELHHVESAKRMLHHIGMDEGHLQCGAHAPYHPASAAALRRAGEEPTPLHNNCSGKHTGMLALAKHLGVSTDNYMQPDHPVQKIMLDAFAAFAGIAPEDIALGIDGCGVPVYGLPLFRVALAFARLGSPEEKTALYADACSRVLKAVSAYPEMIAGSDRYDSTLIRVTGGKVIGKMGAEGVFAATLPEEGAGLALKIEDGAERALYPAVTEALRQLGWISEEQCRSLAPFHRPPVRNWSGTVVGETIPLFQLSRHL